MNTMRSRRAPLAGNIVLALSLIVFIQARSQAEEIRYPVPAYEGKELEEVRAWEKNWAGKKIDSISIDHVKAFIPASLYQVLKNPETWGESWFEIVPYREIKPSKGELAFTRKYRGTCSIGSNDVLLNYISGIPFPSPKTGLEIAHNFDNLNHGDSVHTYQNMYLIDGIDHYDRKMAVAANFLYFSGRREVLPVPEMVPNEKEIYRASHSEYLEPASMRGSRSLNIKWKDRTKPYESYSWSSTTRKIVRKSTAQRQATQGGSDSSSDDQGVYNNAIQHMHYKYLGHKDVLLSRHQDIGQLDNGHREGYCIFDGVQRERINTYVVECIHKNPDYLYSKQIWYVDPETWHILYADKYDKGGRLWRLFENVNVVSKSVYNDARIGSTGFVSILDVKRVHGTAGFSNYTIGKTGKQHQPEYYTPKALQKFGY